MDRFAAALITVGGIGTIVTVSAVFVYLVVMVLPLFRPAALADATTVPDSALGSAPVLLRVAESNEIAWTVGSDGTLTVFRPTTGERLHSESLAADGKAVTAIASTLGDDAIAIGDLDGRVRLGIVQFRSSFLDPVSGDGKKFSDLKPGAAVRDGDGVVSRLPQGQLRRETVRVEMEADPLAVSPGSAVLRLDQLPTDAGPVLLCWSADGAARLVTIERTEDLFTGRTELAAGTSATLPVEAAPAGPPLYVGLAARGAEACLVWADGSALQFDTRDRKNPRFLDRADFAEGDRTVTQVTPMVGRLTLLVGDDRGSTSAWFPARVESAQGGTPLEPVGDGTRFVKGHDLGSGPAAVTAIGPSSQSRLAAIAHADGTLRIVQVTTEDELARTTLPLETEAAQTTIFLPPGEGETTLYAAAGGALYRAAFDAGHPEAGFQAFFRPVWYESYPAPRHVWQTSSGTNATEPKLGLVLLVFGTLKATFYSMVFAVPLALLAALYTSEFLSKRERAQVKPVIEVMASLPSVVLGFIAAMVLAPLVEDWLSAVIAATLTVPLTLLASAHLWQLAPVSVMPQHERIRLPLAGLAILVGLLLAAPTGPLLERLLFAGDLKLWLSGRIGSGAGAWMLLLAPLSALGVAAAAARWLNPWFVQASASWSGQLFAVADLARFAGAVFATLVLGAGLSYLIAALDDWLPLNLDPRGTYVGTYVQRNALVVGFVMGFAIVPIIYTLADDALRAVPESLRSASLGAGATPWQTAMRVVIPAAMSGLFSAVMVGLGRAVGETMIVLMAAGNTPIMELNIFNGFQTLSAAIATEMPEAARGSTHFRTLFLAALVLFALTFCVNTIAEVVRLRFRRRVVQL